MLRRLTHYLSALIFLGALSVVYQNLVNPWMQPPVVTVVPPKSSFDEGGPTKQSLADLFPDGAWQRGKCKQLQSSGGMLLFTNWKQISNDQWKLWPVTVVVGRGLSEESVPDPVIIEAVEGAEIIFTESLDVMSGGAPPIRSGRMIGTVDIRRPNSRDANRAVSIRTANVGIDNRKIWTTEAIDMRFGDARMLGRDLTIHLAGPSSTGGDAESLLDRMELIYLDQFVIPLENGGLVDSQTGAKTNVSLECGGRVEYDFALDQLSLSDSVTLVHQVEGLPPEQFRCHQLELKLLDPSNTSIQRNGPMDWLVRLVAKGTPATAVLPSFDAELVAETIEFNSIAGLVRAGGPKGVRVRRGGIDARLAQLAYQFDPKRPEAIGAIDVQGAGIVNVNDPEIPILRAHWRDGFKLRPTRVTTAKELDTNVELWIDGDVHATLTDGGQFKANAVEGVMKPQKQVTTTRSGQSRTETTLVPERFQATGAVRLDTSAIAAETESLFLEFLEPVDPPAKQSNDPNKKASADNPLRKWVIQPGEGQSTVDPVARPRPVIRGDKISAQLRLEEEGVNANDLNVVGNVNLTHILKAGGQMLPAKLTGERLRLIDKGGEDVLQLDRGAEMARFELGDGFFVGPMIQIRPSDNLVWINDAGEFQMPTAALPTSLTGDKGSSIKWTSAPHCRWNGEMVFNGSSAELTEGVDISASLMDGEEKWEIRMQGDRLRVDLKEDVRVDDMDTIKNAAIHRVVLTQKEGGRPVLVQALRRAADGVLQAKHLMHSPQLTLMPAGNVRGEDGSVTGGRLIGDGPGWYRGWTLPSDKPLIPIADQVADNDADDQLTGIHLIFHDSMQGDLAAKTLQFIRGVRVGVRPVESWDSVIDAAAMDAISLGDTTVDCDRLQFTVAPTVRKRVSGEPIPWEMEANSGVVFRTRSKRGLLEGTANRAAYSSEKDLFTVEGAPNRAAIFRQTLPDGQPGTEGAVKLMVIRPSTMEFKVLKFERLNVATPPSVSPR